MNGRFEEVNFDGLVGPSHHYAGLSAGNMASMGHRGEVSNPREAALQGLDKMLALAERGFSQAVLPPLYRPDLAFLRRLGFSGSDQQVLLDAQTEEPAILGAACSSSAMWAANWATVSPSPDTADARVHFTPANLNAKLHRSQEHPASTRALQLIFGDTRHFVIHPALPGCVALGDEGAANHMRLARSHGEPGVACFVFGRSELDQRYAGTARFQSRQTLEASRAVARTHALAPDRTVFIQQNPAAIDAGVFHNDVIAVSHRDLLFYHEDAFWDESLGLAALQQACAGAGFDLQTVRVSKAEVSLQELVQSYLFNSQLLDLPGGGLLLLVPAECREAPRVSAYLNQLVLSGGPIRELAYVDLRQSMRNGGGPACLRLRVVLSEAQRAAVRGRVMMDKSLHAELSHWVRRHYRERLQAHDLSDPKWVTEVDVALRELERVLDLPGLYPADLTPVF